MPAFDPQLPPSRRDAAVALAALARASSECGACSLDLQRELATAAEEAGRPTTLELSCIEGAIEAAYAAALSCAGAKHDDCPIPSLAAQAMHALRDYWAPGSP